MVVGGSPTASHFFCFAKKNNQKKANPNPPPLRGSLRCASSQAAAEISPRRQPLTSLRYSVADEGWSIEIQKNKIKNKMPRQRGILSN